MDRDKANLDIAWLRDESLEDSSNLPEPGVLAAEIVEELEAALVQFAEPSARPGAIRLSRLTHELLRWPIRT